MSVKRNPTGDTRRSTGVEVAEGPQSAAERRSAEAQVRALIGEHAPAHPRLIASARRGLRERLRTVCEVVHEYRDFFVISFSPNEHGHEGVWGLRASADEVRLYFNRGKDLPDPGKMLQGSGSQVRYIDLEGASTLGRLEVARLIDEAIALNEAPFAPAGDGSVVIRSTSAQKRRGAPPRPAKR